MERTFGLMDFFVSGRNLNLQLDSLFLRTLVVFVDVYVLKEEFRTTEICSNSVLD